MIRQFLILLLCAFGAFAGYGQDLMHADAGPEMVALLRTPGVFAGFSIFGERELDAALRKGLKFNQQKLQNAEAQGNHEDLVTAANNLGWVWSRQGNLEESLRSFERAATAFNSRNNRTGEAIVYTECGYVLALKNNHERSIAYYEKALALQVPRETGVVPLVTVPESCCACTDFQSCARHRWFHNSAAVLRRRKRAPGWQDQAPHRTRVHPHR
jgi:tetratricopeptide (TPR) repeat protein